MTHYAMTHAEHEAARGSYVDPDRYREGHRDYMPEMICRTGDGHAHKDCTRDWSKVDCLACLAKHHSSRVREAIEYAQSIKALGFRVWLASNNTYGFISDSTGSRVLTWSTQDLAGKLGGCYGPPSRESGTGWVHEDFSMSELRTAEDVEHYLYASPPSWAGRGWQYMTTVEQHLATYARSSRYREI